VLLRTPTNNHLSSGGVWLFIVLKNLHRSSKVLYSLIQLPQQLFQEEYFTPSSGYQVKLIKGWSKKNIISARTTIMLHVCPHNNIANIEPVHPWWCLSRFSHSPIMYSSVVLLSAIASCLLVAHSCIKSLPISMVLAEVAKVVTD